MSVYRKDDNGNIKKIAGSLTQRINMHIFQTTHEFDTEKNEDNYIINESDAKPYISSIKDWTQYSINLSEPNESSNINIKLGSQTLKLINNVKNIEIGTLNGVIKCHTEKLDSNEIFLDVVGTVVSLNGVEKTSINTDITPTANSNNLITSGGVHDYPAITFAESERQKSKNLFNYEDIMPKSGLTTDNNGTFYIDTTGYYVIQQLNIPFELNKTYTMSCNVVSITGGNNPTFEFAVKYKDGEWAGYGSNVITGTGIASASFTPTKEVDLFELRFIRQNPAGQRLQATINNLQLEEGSVATDYQPYNGQISHSGDKEIEFARNEYEKSKNLWNSEDIKIGYDRVTYNKDTNTFTYTITSAIVSESTEMAILPYGKLKAGNYIVSFTATSSVGNNAPIIVCEIDSNNNFVTSIGTIYLIDGYKTIPFSLTEEKRIGLAWYYKAGWIAGDAPAGTKTLTNIQLEAGSAATDYQPYHGQITHNGDPAVEFAEKEYQKSKNLLNKDLLKKGCYIFVTGAYDYNTSYMTFEPISVTPNSTITVSCNGFEFNSDCGFVFFNNGVYVGYLSNGATVATVPANANQVTYNFCKENITKDDVQYAQLEYGSMATDYQSYNGAIVHEKDIEPDLIYEMLTKNTIGGVPYTAGIPFSSITISNVDFTSCKSLRFTCSWNNHGSNWFGGTITFDLDLTTPYNSDAEYISVISNRPSNCYISDDALTYDLVGRVGVNGNKNLLNVNGYKITYTGERTAYTSDNYLPYFRIEKIEGIK